ncbi:trace amine-associated receptor 13c-like [Stegastes partitus]|uniref:Trace amine-associated receptor 13c-like n=1 Tax=Stegastes partitus TaxID=144197 RepID=A0A3B5BB50_9TELE|nr:PREDICTED: trace amine-associated receptor 13c-like [Stegastes partitus]
MEVLEEAELCFPQLLNSSCKKPKRPHVQLVVTYVVLSFITVLTTTLNLLVIISISHFKQLHTPTNLLLLSLAVSDFFVGIFTCFQMLLIDGCWYLGDVMCTLYQYLAYIVTSASIGTMVMISVDRYMAICDPLRYQTKVTQRKVQLSVSVCWIFSVVLQTLLLWGNLVHPGRFTSCSGECVVAIDYIAGLADILLSFIGPVAVIVLLYLRVFVVAASQARAMRSHIASVTVRGSVTVMVKKSEMKAARTLGVVVVVFLICLCPYFCVTLTGQDALLNPSSVAFVTCLFYFNSCLNPIIYAFFYPWFRKCLRFIVTLQILQPDSSEANVL